MAEEKANLLSSKQKILFSAISVGVLVVAYIISLFASIYLHSKYIENMIIRVMRSDPNLVVNENPHEFSGLFSTNDHFSITTKDRSFSINVIVNSSFKIPFIENSQIILYQLGGSAITCQGCDFQTLNINGNYTVNYITNSYHGNLAIPNFLTGKKKSVAVNPGEVEFNGKFGTKKVEFVLNLGGFKYIDNEKNIHKNVDKITGDLSISIQRDNLMIESQALKIDQLYLNDRYHDEKMILAGATIKMDNSPAMRSDHDVDTRVSITAKKLSYDNGAYDAEFDVNRVGALLSFNNVDQKYFLVLSDVFKSLFDFLHVDEHRFNYDTLKYFADHNSTVKIDHILLVSTQSVGKLEIEKGGEISFDPNSKLSMKERTKLALKFKITDPFIDDFPNHARIKQLFITENGWLVHGATDSKDEYSTKLTIENGKCTLGEYFLNDC